MKTITLLIILTLSLSAACKPIIVCVPGEGCDTVVVCD